MAGLDALLSEFRVSIVRDVLAALGERAEPQPKPALINKAALARELGVSVRTVDSLRSRGLPTVWVADSPRFELGAVLEWIREQSAAAPAANNKEINQHA